MAVKNKDFCESSITELYQLHQNSNNKPLVIICRNNEHAERIDYTLKEMCGVSSFIIPENEVLPYDEEFPQSDITSMRLRNINKLINSTAKGDVFLIPMRSLLEKVCEPDLYQPKMVITNPSQIDVSEFETLLMDWGYAKKSSVSNLGDFAIHPNVIEIFAFGENKPIRIYLRNKPDGMQDMHYFSLETYLNQSAARELFIFTTREFSFDESALIRFKFRYRKIFGHINNDFLKVVKKGFIPRGADYFKSLFNEKLVSLIDYFPPSAKVLFTDDYTSVLEEVINNFSSRFNEIKDHRDVLQPFEILTKKDELLRKIKNFDTQEVDKKLLSKIGIEASGVCKQDKIHQTFKLISTAHDRTGKTLISINTKTRLKQLDVMFKMKGVEYQSISEWKDFFEGGKGIYVIQSDIDIGYLNLRKFFSIITEFEIFDSKTIEEYQDDSSVELNNLIEFEVGQPVVHTKYGVGRFLGFETFSDKNITKEYAIIQFAESANIWVSLDEMHLLSEYKGIDPENIPLDNTSSKHWNKHLSSAISDVKSMATKLLKIKAKRQMKKREPLVIPAFEYRKFANEFPFAITRDQGRSINDIINDLSGEISMDRLVVGDVGYGKTEVAMRAAMIVAFNKKQCCIIAPTTLLAEQHFETFKERFQSFNFKIALLTRDNKASEKDILKDLSEGNIDIVIGTHRLIQKDVTFKNIGLFVVDEEHRFGVKQKEDINQYRGVVDILSLSATPIPRTLSLTMHGIRDISTIRTAPQKRLAIRTVAHDYDESVIVDALKRELGRGGQAFYIHNNTSTIESVSDSISALLPKARVVFAHGKMKENELQKIMQEFRDHHYDILVATTIVETGIDIPNVNTIIMADCDKFGLSQMHQLRGRVGRSNKQAYAYLLRPSDRQISETATKRLEAMVSHNNLGGGFKISNADLEIRGAGEVLGESQSGHIQELGYQMYFSLLERAIDMLEQGIDLDELSNTEDPFCVHIPKSYSIPSDYIANKGLRASYYKLISEIKSPRAILSMLKEMEERFGKVPSAVMDLANLYKGKLALGKSGVIRTRLKGDSLELKFNTTEKMSLFVNAIKQNNVYSEIIDDVTLKTDFSNFNQEGAIDYKKLGNIIQKQNHAAL